MAIRVIVAAIVGGLFIFFWGFLTWAALGLHDNDFSELPDEAAFVSDLAKQGTLEHRIYFLPWTTSETMSDPKSEEFKAYAEKFKKGPLVTVMVKPDGADPEMMDVFPISGLTDFLVALAISIVVALSSATCFYRRWFIAGMCFLVGNVVSGMNYRLYFYFPADYTQNILLDNAGCALFLGAIVAGIVKVKKDAASCGVSPAA
ncbi:MAG: hypothetical protein NUW37_09135 [Planctomycetes bacterium]|nr:hypothetical protein [Planctomycetota bacterium]